VRIAGCETTNTPHIPGVREDVPHILLNCQGSELVQQPHREVEIGRLVRYRPATGHLPPISNFSSQGTRVIDPGIARSPQWPMAPAWSWRFTIDARCGLSARWIVIRKDTSFRFDLLRSMPMFMPVAAGSLHTMMKTAVGEGGSALSAFACGHPHQRAIPQTTPWPRAANQLIATVPCPLAGLTMVVRAVAWSQEPFRRKPDPPGGALNLSVRAYNCLKRRPWSNSVRSDRAFSYEGFSSRSQRTSAPSRPTKVIRSLERIGISLAPEPHHSTEPAQAPRPASPFLSPPRNHATPCRVPPGLTPAVRTITPKPGSVALNHPADPGSRDHPPKRGQGACAIEPEALMISPCQGKAGLAAAAGHGLHLSDKQLVTPCFDKAQGGYGRAPGWLHPDSFATCPSRRTKCRWASFRAGLERPAQDFALCLQYGGSHSAVGERQTAQQSGHLELAAWPTCPHGLRWAAGSTIAACMRPGQWFFDASGRPRPGAGRAPMVPLPHSRFGSAPPPEVPSSWHVLLLWPPYRLATAHPPITGARPNLSWRPTSWAPADPLPPQRAGDRPKR